MRCLFLAKFLHCCCYCSNIGYLSIALGDLRIREGGNSGQLEIQSSSSEWSAICDTGFDDDAGDVACRQLGYIQSSDVHSYS